MMFKFKILFSKISTNLISNRVAIIKQIVSAAHHRHLSIYHRLYGKRFIDQENRYAHKIFETHSKYPVYNNAPLCTVNSAQFKPDQNWYPLSSADILETFRIITKHCTEDGLCISDSKFDAFVDCFTEKCFDLNDDELVEALRILKHLPETDDINTRNYNELWRCLDDACVERIQSWDIPRILLVCDHWYMLGLARICKFNWEANKKIGRKIRKLPKHQLVQTIFYCNLLRKPIVEMMDFELNMIDSIDKMTIDEIAIMSMGFFKTQTTIKNPDLILAIYNRLIKEVDKVEDICLVNILKILRYSSRIPHSEIMMVLLDKLVKEIPRLSLFSCLHVLLLGTDIQNCHYTSIEIILKRYNQHLSEIRLKDIERLSFVLGLYDFKSKSGIEQEIGPKILIELKNRIQEILLYPRCLPACLHYLTMKGFADEELISSVLHQPFLKLAYKTSANIRKEIFCLDAYTRINFKSTYSGNQLTEKQRQTVGKYLCHYIPDRTGQFKLSATDKILLEINETLQNSFEYVNMAHVLPHFDRPDNILAYDTQAKTGLNIAENFPPHYMGCIVTKDELLRTIRDNSSVQLFNFITSGWNNYIRNEEKLTGLIRLKVEQSKLCGFNPIVIPWFEWIKLTEQERLIYLKHQINLYC